GDEDNEEHDEDQDHPVYDVHDSDKEGDEEGNMGEEGAHKNGGSDEVNMKSQRILTLTKEQVEDVMEREVANIIKDLVDQEVEGGADDLLKETKGSESVGKQHASMSGDPSLTVIVPKVACMGEKGM
ncbi:hypothetical protein KI387_032716, partial [Taxus chinensis]